jgi:hypothetical protein
VINAGLHFRARTVKSEEGEGEAEGDRWPRER